MPKLFPRGGWNELGTAVVCWQPVFLVPSHDRSCKEALQLSIALVALE